MEQGDPHEPGHTHDVAEGLDIEPGSQGQPDGLLQEPSTAWPALVMPAAPPGLDEDSTKRSEAAVKKRIADRDAQAKRDNDRLEQEKSTLDHDDAATFLK